MDHLRSHGIYGVGLGRERPEARLEVEVGAALERPEPEHVGEKVLDVEGECLSDADVPDPALALRALDPRKEEPERTLIHTL
jgi:hypothetical protein